MIANLLFGFHIFWIILMVVGIFLQLKFDFYKPIQFVIVFTTVSSQIIWMGCPLVALESYFRGTDLYMGSFTVYLLNKYFNISVDPIWIVISLIAITALSISAVLWEYC